MGSVPVASTPSLSFPDPTQFCREDGKADASLREVQKDKDQGLILAQRLDDLSERKHHKHEVQERPVSLPMQRPSPHTDAMGS